MAQWQFEGKRRTFVDFGRWNHGRIELHAVPIRLGETEEEDRVLKARFSSSFTKPSNGVLV